MSVRLVRLADLHEDRDIYPRREPSAAWVTSLVEKLEEGAELPPPVVARGGMRIVDGWHRVRALRRFLGGDAEIPADVRSYKSEVDLVKAAWELNEPDARGLPLSRGDRQRAVALLQTYGVTVDEIAVTLRMPEAKVRDIVIVKTPAPAETSEEARAYAEMARRAHPGPEAGDAGEHAPARGPAFWARLGHVRAAIIAVRRVAATVTAQDGTELKDPEYQQALAELSAEMAALQEKTPGMPGYGAE